jgi:ABC-type phosphate/phosphonate transport system, permease component
MSPEKTNTTFWGKMGLPLRKANIFFNGDTKGMTHYPTPDDAYGKRPKKWLVNLIFVAVMVALVILMGHDIRITDCFDRPIQWSAIGEDLRLFFSPDWDYFFGRGFYAWKEGVLYNCILTFCITFIATVIGFFISMPFGLLASHRLFGKKAYISETVLILIRTMPELLLALFLITLSDKSIVTAIGALSFHSIGMIGKLDADQIDEADLDSLEALDACGANKQQRIHLAVMPQAMPSFVSVALYRFDINIRTATTLGLIIEQNAGIGFNILLDYNSLALSKLGADTIGIVIMIIIVDITSSWLRKKLV